MLIKEITGISVKETMEPTASGITAVLAREEIKRKLGEEVSMEALAKEATVEHTGDIKRNWWIKEAVSKLAVIVILSLSIVILSLSIVILSLSKYAIAAKQICLIFRLRQAQTDN